MNKREKKLFGFREDFDFDNRVIKQEYVKIQGENYFVSTVDLGLDHSFGYGEPLYYETMVFPKGDFGDLYCMRYPSKEIALNGHNELVKDIKNDKYEIVDGSLKKKGVYVLKLELGEYVMTRGVNDKIAENTTFAKEIIKILKRYSKCDWGDLEKDDWKINDDALKNGNDRILASYQTSEGKVYIITEYDRSYTTILFANEY